MSRVETDDPAEAERLARELERLNRDRQAVEDRILREASRQVEEWPDDRRARRGYVLADESWHQGVIGIVASRLVERYHRPIVLIAGGEPDWKGSGRSTPAFDLHGSLGACADHLERFGGHRAAAGLSIRPERIEAFAAAFAEHADGALEDDDLRSVTTVDAVLPPGTRLSLDLCAELGRLAPFGLGNPEPVLLAEACELGDLASLGEGKHLRFRVRRGDRDAGSAIAFGLGAQLDRYRRAGRYDVAFRLQENHWNGTVAPQLVVRRVFDEHERYEGLRAWLVAQRRLPADQRETAAQQIFEELGLKDGAKRSLFESPAFLALLDEPSFAAAA